MVDWRTWLAFGFAVGMVFVVIENDQLAEARQKAEASEDAGRQERARLLAGQNDLQQQVDRLVAQNNALVELFRASGVDVPPSLVAGRTSSPGSVTRIETSGDNDDDDAGDTTIVVRPTTAPTSRPPTSNPPPDDDDGGTRIDLPALPLPDDAGEATDTTKRIVDDLTGIKLD